MKNFRQGATVVGMDSQEIQRVNNVCFIILTAIAVTVALSMTRAVCVPLVFALLVYSVAWPFICFLRDRLKINKWFATAITVVAVVLVSFLLGLFVVGSLKNFVKGADFYQDRLAVILEQIKFVAQTVAGLDLEHLDASTLSGLPVFVWAKNFSGAIIGIIGEFSLVMIFVLFMIVGAGTGESSSHFFSEIQNLISRFLITKICINLATALLAGAVLLLFGVDLAILFMILTFWLLFVPGVGPIIALLMPFPIAFLQFGFGGKFWALVTLGIFIHLVLNNLAETKIMGDMVRLHPIAILAGLIFWGLVWGVAGMFLAVPITAALKILLARLPATRGVADLLEGRL